MRLVKFQRAAGEERVGVWEGDLIRPLTLPFQTLADILETPAPAETVRALLDTSEEGLPADGVTLLPPIDKQEVWAAGVTYRRSQTARMEESKDGASFYDKVYSAARPELFFKATPRRVSGPGQPVRIRHDTQWSVPEPELTLAINSRMQLVGFTIGNDMSARDIEGENPLYLPQAKLYNQCAGLGPCVTLAGAMTGLEETGIRMTIRRQGEVAFEGATDLGQLNRTLDDLIGYLARDNSFPDGAFLMTGTGIVPDDEFSLVAGDVVEIAIDGIGVLVNPVVQG